MAESPTPRPSAADWPIAAAMLQFAPTDAEGRPVTDLPAEQWRLLLQPVADAGYRAIEIPSAWLRLGDLSAARLGEFRAVVDDLGLAVPGISVVRESVIHPDRSTAAANLAFSHRMIDAAAELDTGIVCFGLHDQLTPAQRAALWFWTVPGTPYPTDPDVRRQAVAAYRELAEHAGSVGIEISLELYEDTFLGTARESVEFLDEIDHHAVGLNPDLGNLIRRQGPIEAWQDLVVATLPRANYWHVKNYARMEDPANGTVLTHPTSLELGIIDYRETVRFALTHGFTGAFVVEHYGGDGLSAGASNERYLRALLPETPVDPVVPPVSLLRRAA